MLNACAAATLAAQGGDSLAAARRVVAAASLAAREYGLGVAPQGGRVTAPAEVSEAKQFVEQARLDVGALPAAVRAAADADLAALRAMVERAAPPDSVARRADALVQRIAAAAGGALDPFPPRPPSLARGAAVYREQCEQCHGPTGRGDGPKAKQVEGPPPADLTDRRAMSAVSPVDLYRTLTIGVAGTAGRWRRTSGPCGPARERCGRGRGCTRRIARPVTAPPGTATARWRPRCRCGRPRSATWRCRAVSATATSRI